MQHRNDYKQDAKLFLLPEVVVSGVVVLSVGVVTDVVDSVVTAQNINAHRLAQLYIVYMFILSCHNHVTNKLYTNFVTYVINTLDIQVPNHLCSNMRCNLMNGFQNS